MMCVCMCVCMYIYAVFIKLHLILKIGNVKINLNTIKYLNI